MQGSGDDLPEIMFDEPDREAKPESEAVSIKSDNRKEVCMLYLRIIVSEFYIKHLINFHEF